eukprot:6179815-Pleurochrysis_carterae.AAC.3
MRVRVRVCVIDRKLALKHLEGHTPMMKIGSMIFRGLGCKANDDCMQNSKCELSDQARLTSCHGVLPSRLDFSTQKSKYAAQPLTIELASCGRSKHTRRMSPIGPLDYSSATRARALGARQTVSKQRSLVSNEVGIHPAAEWALARARLLLVDAHLPLVDVRDQHAEASAGDAQRVALDLVGHTPPLLNYDHCRRARLAGDVGGEGTNLR